MFLYFFCISDPNLQVPTQEHAISDPPIYPHASSLERKNPLWLDCDRSHPNVWLTTSLSNGQQQSLVKVCIKVSGAGTLGLQPSVTVLGLGCQDLQPLTTAGVTEL